MTSPYPPHVKHHAQAIPVSAALEHLQTYLHDSETQAWLHPDAVLSEGGPQFARTLSGGLTLHNLRRVEAGLRGERLGTDLSLAELAAETGMNYNKMSEEIIGGGGGANEGGEWQDMDDFCREQEIVEGDVEKRDNAVVQDGGEVPRLVEQEQEQGQVRLVDKEVRKREKKERRREERRLKNEGRKRERD